MNFWRPWSATDIGSQTIFRLIGVDVKADLHRHRCKALEKVKSGEIAATVLLAGAPVPGYAKLQKGRGAAYRASRAEQPVSRSKTAKLLEVYLPTKLTHKQYPNHHS